MFSFPASTASRMLTLITIGAVRHLADEEAGDLGDVVLSILARHLLVLVLRNLIYVNAQTVYTIVGSVRLLPLGDLTSIFLFIWGDFIQRYFLDDL